MGTEIWINLPVKDVEKSKKFFTKIGFSLNKQYADSDESACLLVGDKNIPVLLFVQNTFKGFTKNELTDTKQSSEVLLSFSAESREEVDEMARKVFDGGGAVFSEPSEMNGWMYGFAFADLDGHRWNQVFMDMGKMPKEEK